MIYNIESNNSIPNIPEKVRSQETSSFRYSKDIAANLLAGNKVNIEDLYSTKIFSLWGTKTEGNSPVKEAVQDGFPEIFAHAINFYTSAAFRLINPHLRKQNEAFISHVKQLQGILAFENDEVKGSEEEITAKYEKEASMLGTLLSDALSILPSYKGTVYRGDLLTDEELELVKSGVYFDPAAMSFSKNKENTLPFAKRLPMNEGEKHRVFITVESTQGKEIADFSEVKKEEEVIFRPGQKFKVESIEEQKMKCVKGIETISFIKLSEINN